jgi:hypothetical protein
MSSVRLTHDDGLRNVIVTVTHPHLRYPSPQLCPSCHVLHAQKTYHIWFDDSAGAVVAPEVFTRLQQCGLPNMTVESEVVSPPSATLNMDRGKKIRVVHEQQKIQLRNVGV